MGKTYNKDIVQSYIMTSARYDFSVYEKRIIYRLIERFQYFLEGNTLDHQISIQHDLFDGKWITMPVRLFLANEDDTHYDRAKKALEDLESKSFHYEDDHEWELIRIIQNPKIDKDRGMATFRLNPKIFDAILDFSKGFKKFEFATVMSFESVYAMRLYELLSGQKTPITYSIEQLKAMFQVEKKYKQTADFIKRTIEVAQKELDKKSPYSFKYTTKKTGSKITHIVFYPVYISENRDPVLEARTLQKNTSLRWDLPNHIIEYLTTNYFFTENEIKNNIEVVKRAYNNSPDLLMELSKMKDRAAKARSTKGYVINAMKKMK